MRRRTFLTGLAMSAVCPLCATHAMADDVHWGYSGHAGPPHWASLGKANAACSAGTQQSPLNITGSVEANLPALSTEWKNGGRMVNNGHTIQINATPGSTLKRGDQPYELLQYHFHHPSEHLVEGKRFAMETHFVHRKGGGSELGVLGVMLVAGTVNTAFAQLAASFPARAGQEVAAATSNPAGLLPPSLAYWFYEGSLTTPPCTENVEWMVAKVPVEVAERDIAAFAALYANNARPIQPAGRRLILASR